MPSSIGAPAAPAVLVESGRQSRSGGDRSPVGELAWGIRVRAASRLSFMMIDMNGEGGRRNGVASLSLAEPAFQAILEPARRSAVSVDSNTQEYGPVIADYLRRLRRALNGPPVRVVIEHGLPPHSGFGSKTTTLLSVGQAYAALSGRTATTEELARLAGRAGTSGASVNLIDHGGFVVDGGHLNPPDFHTDPGRYLVPSRFATVSRKPPLLIRLAFPNWPILVILPAASGLHGRAELDWFSRTLPIPAAEAHRAAHLALMRLATAVAEVDYDAFCQAVRSITYENYFKRAQISTQPEVTQRLLEEARDNSDIDAIGMSSMGPMCFAFTRQPNGASSWLARLHSEGAVRAYWYTAAQNWPIAMTAAVPRDIECRCPRLANSFRGVLSGEGDTDDE